MSTIKTIMQACTTELKIKGSSFVCTLLPLKTPESFDSFLKESRKIHFKASHNCQAYRIGPEPLVEFQSDDGEPRGSAGQPMLNTLKSAELMQVGAVVVRYFGGTKLGVRGLIDAYGDSCKQCIEQAELVELTDKMQFRLIFPYNLQSQINTIVHGYELQNLDASYGQEVCIDFSIAIESFPQLENKLAEHAHLGFSFSKIGRAYLPK